MTRFIIGSPRVMLCSSQISPRSRFVLKPEAKLKRIIHLSQICQSAEFEEAALLKNVYFYARDKTFFDVETFSHTDGRTDVDVFE